MRVIPNDPYDERDAWRRLGIAIIEQVVDDINHLKRAGMIKNGQPMKWPKRPIGKNAFRVANDFDSDTKLHDLVNWIHSKECAELLEQLDIPATQDDLINLLNRQSWPERHNTLRRAV